MKKNSESSPHLLAYVAHLAAKLEWYTPGPYNPP